MANGRFNLLQYANSKTVQLSDAYKIKLYISLADYSKIERFIRNSRSSIWVKTGKLNNSKCVEIELPECLSVTLPDISVKEEEFTYGNNSKIILIPDYEKPEDLKLEFFEHYDALNPWDDNTPIGFIELLVNLFLSKLFDSNHFAYKLLSYINELHIQVYSNNMTTCLYTYQFKELKLTNYSKYNLDYSAANMCKYTLSFSYNTYKQYMSYDVESANLLFNAEDIPIKPEDLIDDFEFNVNEPVTNDNSGIITEPNTNNPTQEPGAVPTPTPTETPTDKVKPTPNLKLLKTKKAEYLIDVLNGKIKTSYTYKKTDKKTKEVKKITKYDAGIMGLAEKDLDLDIIYNYGLSEGYDFTKMQDVQKFMFDKRVFSAETLSQCTRGTAFTHQLLEYARDIEEGRDRSKTHTYHGAIKASEYDITIGRTTTYKSEYHDWDDSIRKDFTKNSDYSKKAITGNELTKLGDTLLKNSGDYITYEAGDSWHIVSLYIDENGGRHYYSDYEQKNERGVNSYKGLVEKKQIKNVQVYNYHGE